MRRARMWLKIIAGLACTTAAAQSLPTTKSFSLAGQVSVELDDRWNDRRDAEPPPLRALAAFAPKLEFSDILILENPSQLRILHVALTDNPYVGRNAAWLDESLRAPRNSGTRMAEHLFFFFFPPPDTCIEQGRQEFEQRKHKQELEAERGKDGKLKRPLSPLDFFQPCAFSTTLRQLFAEQVSTGLSFHRQGETERVEARLSSFYLPPMEEVETGGRTFFVFEEEGQRLIETVQIEKYGLPEEMRGARAHFFWAIGAPTPFPFLKDPARKDVQLLHVVYACLSPDGSARKEFFELLGKVR